MPAAEGPTVADAMLRRPTVHPADLSFAQAQAVFDASPRTHLLLLADDGVLVATLSRADVAAGVRRLRGRTVSPDAPLGRVHRDMLRRGERRLAVVDSRRRLLGLLCLKRSGTGFCTDDGVAAMRRQRVSTSMSTMRDDGGMPTDEDLAVLTRRVQLLEDQAELTALLNRYCLAADTDDFDGHADCFTEDAVLVTRMGESRGRAAIIEMNRSFAVDYAKLQHSMSNMSFEVDGDRATGRSSLRFTAVASEGEPAAERAGRYEFEFRREDGRWRICWERLETFAVTVS